MALWLSILIVDADANFTHTHTKYNCVKTNVIDNIHVNDCRGGKLIFVTDVEAC